MRFDFDKPTERRGTGSLKWNVAEGELPMWVADMDFEAAPPIRAAITRCAERGIFGYSDTPNEYFEEAASFFKRRYGAPFEADELIYVAGVVPALSTAVRRLTAPNENVLVQAPVYNIFYNCIVNNGRRVVSSDLVYKNGEYSMDFDDLEKKLADPQTALMILCNPHNPVGRIWTRDELARVAELAERHGVLVVSDEIHSPITRPAAKYVPFATVGGDRAITCIAASKAFNIAGLQAACIHVKDPVLRHKLWRAVNTDEVGEPNVFAIDANVAAYRDGEPWLDALNEYLFENRRFAEEFIAQRLPRLHAVKADASYLLWLDISAYSHDSEGFAKELRKKTGLYVNDGAEYGHGGESFLRINLATRRALVLDGLERLAAFCAELDSAKHS